MSAENDNKESSVEIESQAGVAPEDMRVPEVLSILPLHGFVFFPGMGFPLQVPNQAAKDLIDKALVSDRLIGMVSHRAFKGKPEKYVSVEHLFEVGVLGYIHKMSKEADGVYQVLISSVKKLKFYMIML